MNTNRQQQQQQQQQGMTGGQQQNMQFIPSPMGMMRSRTPTFQDTTAPYNTFTSMMPGGMMMQPQFSAPIGYPSTPIKSPLKPTGGNLNPFGNALLQQQQQHHHQQQHHQQQQLGHQRTKSTNETTTTSATTNQLLANNNNINRNQDNNTSNSNSNNNNNGNFPGMNLRLPMDDSLNIYPDDASDTSSMVSASEALNVELWDVSPSMSPRASGSATTTANNNNNNASNTNGGMGRSSSYSSFETMSSTAYYNPPSGNMYLPEQFSANTMSVKHQQRISTPQPQRMSEPFMTPQSPQPNNAGQIPTIQVSYQPKMMHATPQSPAPQQQQPQMSPSQGYGPPQPQMSAEMFAAVQDFYPQQQQQQHMSPTPMAVGNNQAPAPKIRSPQKGKSKPREHPLGEHPSRTLFVRNISSSVEDEELKTVFSQYGSIRNMYTSCKHRGFVMITYYDIRHARQAKHDLQGHFMRRRELDIHYSIPKENPSEKDMNQGTLVVFNLAPEVTNEEIQNIFGRHGQVKEVRETPNKAHHRFVEFYDSRDADRALKSLNKKEIHGKKIKIECSRPGGRSRGASQDMAITGDKKRNKSPYRPHSSGSSSGSSNGGNGGSSGNIRYKIDLDLVRDHSDVRTTLMIKNIPNKYSQRMLLELIDRQFAGCYNFFYLPIDFKNKCNVGYAFINLTNPLHIVNFAAEFNGKKWHKFNSEKVCELTYGRVQGKLNLNDHFANSSLMCEDESCRPVFFDDHNIPPAKNQILPSDAKSDASSTLTSSTSSSTSSSPLGTSPHKWRGKSKKKKKKHRESNS